MSFQSVDYCLMVTVQKKLKNAARRERKMRSNQRKEEEAEKEAAEKKRFEDAVQTKVVSIVSRPMIKITKPGPHQK